MKYLTIAKHSSFAVVIRTCPVPVQLKPSFYKVFPFLLKDFPRFFGRIESRDLICIRLTSQKNPFRIFICLLRVYVVMNKASEDGPPPAFFRKVTADPCLYLPEFPEDLPNRVFFNQLEGPVTSWIFSIYIY